MPLDVFLLNFYGEAPRILNHDGSVDVGTTKGAHFLKHISKIIHSLTASGDRRVKASRSRCRWLQNERFKPDSFTGRPREFVTKFDGVSRKADRRCSIQAQAHRENFGSKL